VDPKRVAAEENRRTKTRQEYLIVKGGIVLTGDSVDREEETLQGRSGTQGNADKATLAHASGGNKYKRSKF